MAEEKIYFNGIDGSTGEYLFPPLSTEQLAKVATGEEFDDSEIKELTQKNRQVKGLDVDFAPKEGIDPKDLAQTGWGVIFSYDSDPAIKQALQVLLDHRKQQATQQNENYYQEYVGVKGYRPGESKNQFLSRHRVGPGPADPDRMPYYLLIVGDPETIPFRFQHQLDVQYAVGRIHFDTPAEYAQYARSVVKVETENVALPRHAHFFGVQTEDDPATQLSAQKLVEPLSQWMVEDQASNSWSVETELGKAATKEALATLLGGSKTPALLFTASHGLGFKNGDRRQLHNQGAILCQDWPGPVEWERRPIPNDFYFSGDDLSDDARLLGLISFHFACYSAGTPKFDEFSHRTASGERPEIAPHAFISSLSKRLLSHPNGGALAVIGHIERAWGCSFVWEDTGAQLAVFESTLKRLLEGHTVGSAVEYFNERYAELSSDLSSELEEIKYGKTFEASDLSSMWTANNDARGYAIIGDPAVKLPVGGSEVGSAVGESSERPTIAATGQDFSEAIALPKPSKSTSSVEQAQNDLNQVLAPVISAIQQKEGAVEKSVIQQALSATIQLLEALHKQL